MHEKAFVENKKRFINSLLFSFVDIKKGLWTYSFLIKNVKVFVLFLTNKENKIKVH